MTQRECEERMGKQRRYQQTWDVVRNDCEGGGSEGGSTEPPFRQLQIAHIAKQAGGISFNKYATKCNTWESGSYSKNAISDVDISASRTKLHAPFEPRMHGVISCSEVKD